MLHGSSELSAEEALLALVKDRQEKSARIEEKLRAIIDDTATSEVTLNLEVQSFKVTYLQDFKAVARTTMTEVENEAKRSAKAMQTLTKNQNENVDGAGNDAEGSGDPSTTRGYFLYMALHLQRKGSHMRMYMALKVTNKNFKQLHHSFDSFVRRKC